MINFEVQTPECPFIQNSKGLCTAKVNLQGSFLFVHIKDCTVRYWIQILSLRNQNAKAIQRWQWWNHSGFRAICKLLDLVGKLQQAEFICTGLLVVTFPEHLHLCDFIISCIIQPNERQQSCFIPLSCRMEPGLNPDFSQTPLTLDKQDPSTPRFWLILWSLSDKSTWAWRKVTESMGKDTGKGNKHKKRFRHVLLSTTAPVSLKGALKQDKGTGWGWSSHWFPCDSSLVSRPEWSISRGLLSPQPNTSFP